MFVDVPVLETPLLLLEPDNDVLDSFCTWVVSTVDDPPGLRLSDCDPLTADMDMPPPEFAETLVSVYTI